MSFGYTRSGEFSGASSAEVAGQIADWLESVPGLSLFDRVDSSGKFSRAVFMFREMHVGIDLSVSGSTVSLIASVPIASIKPGASSSTLKTAAVSDIGTEKGKYSMTTRNEKSGGVTTYYMGAWYGTTDKGGLVVGLYRDESNPSWLAYPAYMGTVRDNFYDEEITYCVQLNRGAYPVGGVKSSGNSYKANETAHSVSPGMSNGNGLIEFDHPKGNLISYYPLLLQNLHQYQPVSSTALSKKVMCYTPLYATLTDKFWPGFQVDDFVTGDRCPDNPPAQMGEYTVNGQRYLVISRDNVAIPI